MVYRNLEFSCEIICFSVHEKCLVTTNTDCSCVLETVMNYLGPLTAAVRKKKILTVIFLLLLFLWEAVLKKKKKIFLLLCLVGFDSLAFSFFTPSC